MFRSLKLKIPSLGRGLTTITETLGQSSKRIAVLYGTHSGNCQKHAQQLQSELRTRFDVEAPLHDISDVDFRGLEMLKPDDTLLILMSTYGEGEPNKATRPLWDYVQSKASQRSPFDFSFSILSRGSSLYETTFARAGLKLDQQLLNCGAHQLAPAGVQDKISPHSYDEYFDWKESALSVLKARKNLDEQPYRYEAAVQVEELEPQPWIELSAVYHRLDPQAEQVGIRVEKLQRTDRQYVKANLDLSGYQCGDYVVIWPTNPEAKVQQFLHAVFGQDARRANLVKVDGVTTSYELLARHLIDVNGQPGRDLLLKLEYLAPSQAAAERTRELLKRRDHALPALADLLAELSPDEPWIKSLPPSALIDILPALEPRKYSISSSPQQAPDQAELTCVVEHDSASNFWGVATGDLLRVAELESSGSGSAGSGPTVMAAIEPLPEFRMPSDPQIPLLMFGVGTGVAPFCGFVRERATLSKQVPVGRSTLFTGTRSRDDLIHHRELEAYASDRGANFELLPSYSRVPASDSHHGYIADTVRKHDQLIFDEIQNGAHIYICGDVRKVRSHVRNAILDILTAKLGLSRDQRKPQWKKLKKAGRIHMELW